MSKKAAESPRSPANGNPSGSESASADNPLLQPSTCDYGAVPFTVLKVEHFLPALTAAIAVAKSKIAAIKTNPAPPDFYNTMAALEAATAQTYDVAYVYSNLRSANGDEAMQALAKEVMPRLIELESDVNLDPALFQRVKAAYEQVVAATAAFTAEQRTLAERMYLGFKRNGGLLDDAGKRQLRTIDDELSTLGPQFSEHVLKATNAYQLVLRSEADLAGLPASVRDAAAADARSRNLGDNVWLFTLQAPSLTAFLRYADRRDLREAIWRASSTRAFSGEHSNIELVRRITSLRYQRAKLLGYASHAHFQMEERMAEHPDRVRSFLAKLLEKSKPAAEREMAELRQFMTENGASHALMPWDYGYWANKLKESRYGFSAESLRPYFRLEQVLAGAFELARRLFGLEFRAVQNVPVYASEVQVFEVVNAPANEYMGLLYTDFFPRATKGGGAWCTRFKPQWLEGQKDHRPHVSIVCNFTRPTESQPSLLTFQEANTLFHEFGHALHSLLSRCTHRGLSGTSVYRDFVELPSQILENWLREKDGLALFARHYETGAEIPAELMSKLLASEQFHAAYLMMRQLRFGYLDMAWYGGDPTAVQDVGAFETAAVAPTDLLPNVPGTNISCAFEHIFAGGYSAGYYGYKWAEVLDADAFEVFKAEGIFSAAVGERFRRAILQRGGSEHPMRLYREFRGREPDPEALLRRSGL